ncbi:MAG TPA: family 1 encapsulin nanocompartment shell protein [Burkholderiales bacterium]|nr:family 1 encapsulin nanocompartment shell protein [Burkholderiales bacterium]
MNPLFRELAPITGEAWALIEEEAKRTLKLKLAARKLVDFLGPLGWEASAVNVGRVQRLDKSPAEGVEARLRELQPLVELRIPFALERDELDAAARGAKDAVLDAVRDAAGAAASAEDRAVFNGFPAAGIRGIVEEAAEAKLTLTDDYQAYPAVVADAINRLHLAGVHGPYGIALGPRCYTGLTKTTQGGYPVMEHVRRLLDGPIVWAPAVDGAVVLSLRGGDFELTVGQDFSVGYLEHTASTVRLYLQESITFRVLAGEAAVPLAYAKKA